MNLLWKGIALGVLLVCALFFNYPSVVSIISDDTEQLADVLKQKQEQVKIGLAELRGLNLALKDKTPGRIRVLMDDSKDFFPLQNVIIQSILENKFTVLNEDDNTYLQVKPEHAESIFITDYLQALNQLFDSVRKIKSVAYDPAVRSLVFAVEPGRRISAETEPIQTLLSDQFSWVYVAENHTYLSAPKESDYVLNLGLDLQGGMYLDVGIDTDEVFEGVLSRLALDLEELLIEERVDFDEVFATDDQSVQIVLSPYENLDLSKPPYDRFLEGYALEKVSGGYSVSFGEEQKSGIQEAAFNQIIDTISNRIDALGVKEPSIQRKGAESIVVQLPGQDDPGRAKSLLTKPASLEFRFVEENATPANPGNGLVLNQELLDPITKEVVSVSQLVVENKIAMRGDVVRDARVIFGQSGLAEVGLSLNSQGTSRFTEITSKNINRRLAIILDNKIQSAPVIQAVISGGEASITGNFSVEEARDLSIVLRSGSLPAPLVINEERTVGASLGADSVRTSLTALFLGFAAVILFIIVYYRAAGCFSILSLLFNILLIVAVLVYFGAVLTLPGIAGIILTVGMSIDASVLIFERIREELARGSAPRKAIKVGFSRATSTILDANITTIIAAIVLFQFGTGPIKGFAVTLSIGVVVSIFTSIIVTRYFFELVYLQRKNLERISI